MKKDRNYWMERGKDFKQRGGFVCIGVGDFTDHLVSQEPKFRKKLCLGIGGNFLCSEGHKDNNIGNSSVGVYYIEQKEFDDIFPLPVAESEIIPSLCEMRDILVSLSDEDKKKIFEKYSNYFSFLNFNEFVWLIENSNQYQKDSFIYKFLKKFPNPLEFRLDKE